MVFFNLLKDENGSPVCTVSDCFCKGIAWGPVLLFMLPIVMQMGGNPYTFFI